MGYQERSPSCLLLGSLIGLCVWLSTGALAADVPGEKDTRGGGASLGAKLAVPQRLSATPYGAPCRFN